MEIKEGYNIPKGRNNPRGWILSNLGDVANIVGGGTPSSVINEYWNGDINWFTPTEISDKKYYKNSKRKISLEGLNNSSAKLLPPGTILLTSRASIGDVGILIDEASTNQGFQSLIVNDKADEEFLYYLIGLIKPNLVSLSKGSTFLEIGSKDIKSIVISLPPLPEQKAIAEVLSDTDALIESLEAKIKKKKAIKKGAMQKLLQPQPHWEKFSINDICDIISGKDLSKNKLSKNGKYKCILYGELFTTYSEVIDTVKSKTNYAEGVLSKKGDILFPNSTTTIGEDLAKASSLEVSEVYLSGGIIILRKKKEYDSNFLSFFLNQVAKPEIAKQTKGITIYHLYGSDLRDIKVRLPKLAEQEYIAKSLNDMDEEIELLKVKLYKYRSLKEGLMQELLTGKIRLV